MVDCLGGSSSSEVAGYPEVNAVNNDNIPEDLLPLLALAPEWALATERRRQSKRASSSMEALAEFYSAMTPHVLAIGSYLDSVTSKTLSASQEALLHLAFMYMEVALAVETYGEPDPQDNFPRQKFVNPYDPVSSPA